MIHRLLDPAIQPSGVVMNPPFTAGVVKSHQAAKSSKYGFNHVESALQRLAPGGRAGIIMGDLRMKKFGPDRGSLKPSGISGGAWARSTACAPM